MLAAPPLHPPVFVACPRMGAIRGGYRCDSCQHCEKRMWRTLNSEVVKSCIDCVHTKSTCGICLDFCRPLAKLRCCEQHTFCVPCVATYVSTKIAEGFVDLCCPQPGCSMAITNKMITNMKNRGQISEETMERLRATTLDNAKRVLRHTLSEPKLAEWVMENAQSCPGCFSVVQKSEGCRHMTCTCGTEFCWICGNKYPCQGCTDTRPRIFNCQGVIATAAPRREENELLPRVDVTLSTEASPTQAIHEMLTLKCPRCDHGFHMDASFEECFALQCSACPARFCAWCLRDCNSNGEDPHTHVLDCAEAPVQMRGHALYLQEHNGGPHVAPKPQECFHAHWNNRHRMRIKTFLSRLEPAEMEEVLATIPSDVRPDQV